MSLSFVTLSDENINRVLEDPPLVWQVIAPEEPGLYEAARAEQSKSGVLSKLFRRAAPAERSPDLEMSSAEGIATDIDKAWHGIHYLLTGTEEQGEYPRSFLLAGGRLVGDVDVGYGPARVLSSKETREARDFLNTLADAELRRRFNPADMLARKIYPEIWDRDPAADDTLGYLIEHVRTLRGFLNQTVDNGCGIVVYLS